MRGAKKTKKGVRNQEAGDKTSRGGGQDRGTSPGKQTIQNCTEVRKQMAGKGLTDQFPNDGLVSPFDQGGFSPIPFPHFGLVYRVGPGRGVVTSRDECFAAT